MLASGSQLRQKSMKNRCQIWWLKRERQNHEKVMISPNDLWPLLGPISEKDDKQKLIEEATLDEVGRFYRSKIQQRMQGEGWTPLDEGYNEELERRMRQSKGDVQKEYGAKGKASFWDMRIEWIRLEKKC